MSIFPTNEKKLALFHLLMITIVWSLVFDH